MPPLASDVQARLSAHLRQLVGERHPRRSPAALQQAEQYLISSFQRSGLLVKTHGFRALGGTYHNVVASLPTVRDKKAPPLLIGAHYDTVAGSPGADDNASGLAVMLEAAEQLAKVSLARPVHFIGFGLEEWNLLGSRAYAAYLRKQGRDIQGAIVLECVGFASQTEGSQTQPPIPMKLPAVGDFLGVVGNEPAKALVEAIVQAGQQAAVPLRAIPLVVPGQGEQFPDTRRSDHASFWSYGFPAVMLTDTANFRNPNYHQPTDTVETLNLDFLAKVAATVTRAGIDLAGLA
ncbi:MAG: M20/M25/M40 family metallo-hydrolase [Nitrospiraceae bacterium]